TLANTWGVLIEGGPSNNTVGGTAAGAGNTISGNTNYGVAIADGGTTANRVEGNRIGTNAAGSAALANGQGVVIEGGASGNTVGGTEPGAANPLSGNTYHGVWISGPGTTGNAVEGNRIGTNADGSAALANENGVVIDAGASGNTVGGADPGAANTVSGNTAAGVRILNPGTTANRVEGNRIGTQADGIDRLANAWGVLIEGGAGNNTVGGTAAGAGN